MAEDPETLDVVCALLRQLRDFPQRADTVEGIARWWLPEGIDPSSLQRALAWLKERDLIEQHIAVDTRVRYRRKASPEQLQAQLAVLDPSKG